MRPFVAIAAVLAAVLAGCGGHETFVHPPTPEMRQDFGQIGLVARPSGPPIGYAAGASVVGASAGADYGAGKAVEGCFEFWLEASRDPLSFLGAVMFAVGCSVVAAPVGAIAGSTRARSPEEVVRAKDNIDRVLGAVASRAFRDHVVSAMRRRTDRRIGVLGTANVLSPEEPRLRGVDSLLWLDVVGGFSATGGEIDPDVSFLLSAKAAVVRRDDGRLLYERSWQYQGPERTHFSFAENGGETLRADVDQGFRMLAERIVFDLFVNTEPERILWRVQDENTVRTLGTRDPRPVSGPATPVAPPDTVPKSERPTP